MVLTQSDKEFYCIMTAYTIQKHYFFRRKFFKKEINKGKLWKEYYENTWNKMSSMDQLYFLLDFIEFDLPELSPFMKYVKEKSGYKSINDFNKALTYIKNDKENEKSV